MSAIDPPWRQVAEFTPLLIERRKKGLGPLAFVYLASGMRCCFDPRDAVWDFIDSLYYVPFEKVAAFTSDGLLMLQTEGRR